MPDNTPNNMYVKKALAGVEDLSIGFSQTPQVRANSQIPITQINASHFQGVLVFDTFNELVNTPRDYMGDKKCAVVKETGQIYFNYGEGWGTAQNIAFQVKTIEDLKKVPPEVGICAVSDPIRGGIFSYVKTNSDINNGGTIFDGWTRNYEDAVNVRWFGATGNGLTDDTKAINKALAFSTNVIFPLGKYLITDTLTLQPNAQIKGSSNTLIISESDNIMLQGAVGAVIENLTFKGSSDLQNQIAISLTGGAGHLATSKVRVQGCRFQVIGGSGIFVSNIDPIQSNEILDCSFSGCSNGIKLGQLSDNTLISSCMFLSCSVGIHHNGHPSVISASTFINNSIGMFFTAGQPKNAKTLISSCLFNASKIKSLKFDSVTNKGYLIENCTIATEVEMVNTDFVTFQNCNFIGGSISFQASNNNKFLDCLCENIKVANDVGGVATLNYFTRPILDTPREDCSKGGWVEATRVTSDLALTANVVNPVLYNQFKQGMCFHSGFNKVKFYTQDSGLFNFVDVSSPASPTEILADVRLILSKNDTTTMGNVAVFLYKLNTANENVGTEGFDTSRMFLFQCSPSFENAYSIFAFNGYIPRGYYKVFVRVGAISNLNVVQNKSPFLQGKGKVKQLARFWGI